MRNIARPVAFAALVGVSLYAGTAVCADDADAKRNAYVQTDLVSDGAIPAKTTDPDLKNAWGIAFFPGGPFWIADNATGLSTLYDGTGAKQSLVVTIPPPKGATADTTATPTGMAWNPTTQFQIPGTNLPSLFIFATEDGTISAWNPNLPDRTRAVLAVDNSTSATDAVYKGLAIATNSRGNFLFAANFHAGTVDVFDSNFAPAKLDGTFTDPDLPAGFAPFGIRNIDGDLFVTYALQNAEKHDDVAGLGNGFVDVFDTDGHLIQRFASRGQLNSPWGITRASFDFGPFSGDILIGNFGDGRINVFGPGGEFLEQLQGTDGKAIEIDGLWSLTFGGASKSDPDTLYFTAGPNEEMNGLFGSVALADRQNSEAAAQ
jgi:uncharacterized protein (TIGR03118 family)